MKDETCDPAGSGETEKALGILPWRQNRSMRPPSDSPPASAPALPPQDPDAPPRFGTRPQQVLVTGGTKGVGRGIAERFLEAGATVVVTARSEPASLPSLEPGADGGTGTGGDTGTDGRPARTATFLPADVRDPEAVAALVDEVVATHGRLDVVVNNAGGAPPAEAATASLTASVPLTASVNQNGRPRARRVRCTA